MAVCCASLKELVLTAILRNRSTRSIRLLAALLSSRIRRVVAPDGFSNAVTCVDVVTV
jgi:hypothetical protein